MFVTSTRNNFFAAQDNDASRKLNESVTKKFKTIYSEQADEEYLKRNAMPKVCQGMDYTPPTVAKHNAGPKHENTFVITNNAHVKQTNNGYKRCEGGAFYCH